MEPDSFSAHARRRREQQGQAPIPPGIGILAFVFMLAVAAALWNLGAATYAAVDLGLRLDQGHTIVEVKQNLLEAVVSGAVAAAVWFPIRWLVNRRQP